MELQLSSKEKELEQLFQKQRRVSRRAWSHAANIQNTAAPISCKSWTKPGRNPSSFNCFSAIQLEQQYQELHGEQHVTKVENIKLKQTNDELVRELDQTSQELLLAQEQLGVLQEQSSRLHEEKEMWVSALACFSLL